jgi:hypothetical protein
MAKRKDLKFSSFFYNQTSFIIDRKTKMKVATLNWTLLIPQENVLGLSSSLEEIACFVEEKEALCHLFILKIKQKFTSIGSQESNNSSHQVQYSHLYRKGCCVCKKRFKHL